MMAKILKRYKYFIAITIIVLIVSMFDYTLGINIFDITLFSLKEMMLVIPPIFILLGLLDVWVPRETMIRFMGDKSGFAGILLAFFIGSAAAGPLYGAFPVAAVLMKKGAKFSNVMIFVGAWSTTKIPMILFEMASLGTLFALTRLSVSIIGIIIIAIILSSLTDRCEINQIYLRAEEMGN